MRRLGPMFLVTSLLTTIGALPAAEDRPIPQNPAAQAKFYRDLLEWNRETLVRAYDRVGKKNGRWDKPAHDALEAAARFFGRAVDPTTREEEIYALAKRAIDARCDDPIILYLYARTSNRPNFPGIVEYERRVIDAAVALERSNYPPIRRAVALQKAGQLMVNKLEPSEETRRKAVRLLDAALLLVPKSVASDGRTIEAETEWFELVKSILTGYRTLAGSYDHALARVDSVLAKAPALQVMRLQAKAYSLIQSGAEARSADVGRDVTKDGARLFKARLSEADKVLRQSWALRPTGAQTPDLMLIVLNGLGSTRTEMETWFQRAMQTDGNNLDACMAKMEWLDPRAHGTKDDLLAFGRACRATGNWRAGLTLMAAEAHLRVSRQMSATDAARYMASPRVWSDVRSVYEEYLNHYPDSYSARAPYAAYCCLCGRYADANKQFTIVGDNLWTSPLISLDMMKKLRDYAAARVRAR